MTTETRSLEPPIAQGIVSAVVAIVGLVAAAVSLIAIVFAPWLTGWLRLAPLPVVFLGLLLFLRFTRDDRNIMGRIVNLELDCVDYEMELQHAEVLLEAKDDLIADHVETVEFLRDLLANPVQTLKVRDRNGERIIPKHERNITWRYAMELVSLADGDHGKLPGHERTGRTQNEQTAALKLLKHVGVAMPKGTIWRLTVTRQAAIDLLNSFAAEVNANPSPDTPPATPPDDQQQDSTSYLDGESSGFASSWVEPGEVVP